MVIPHLILLPIFLFGTGNDNTPQSAPVVPVVEASSTKTEEKIIIPSSLPVEAYPLKGNAAKGVRSFLKGEYSLAKSALSSSLQSKAKAYRYPLSFLYARTLIERGLEKKATTLLEELLDERGDLDGEIAFMLASIYEKNGKTKEAKETFAKIPRGSRHYDEARLGQGRLSTDLESAKAIFAPERFYWTNDRAEALSILLSFAKKEKNTEEIRNLTLQLFTEYPATGPGDEVQDSIFSFSPSEKELFQRFEVLMKKKKTRNATSYLAFLEKRLGSNDSIVLEGKGELSYKSRNWKKAADLFQKAQKTSKTPERAIRRRGNAFSRQKEYETALKLYRSVYKKDSEQTPFALLDAIRILRDQNKIKEATKLANRAVDEYPNSPARKDALWVSAWFSWRTGDNLTTISRLSDLIDYTNQMDASEREEEYIEGRKLGFHIKERALYWMARAQAREKQTKEAIKTYQTLVEQYPLSYYSHQAYDRLRDLDAREILASLRVRKNDETPLPLLAKNQKGEIVTVSTISIASKEGKKNTPPTTWTVPAVDKSALVIDDDPSIRAAVMMIGLGMTNSAIEELRSQSTQETLSSDGGTLLGSLMLEKEGVSKGAWIMQWRWEFLHYPGLSKDDHAIGSPARHKMIDLGWKIAYPRAYGEVAEYYANQFEVPQELVFSVMRAESTFRPKVVSPARAVGLMQVLPSTARWVAKELLKTSKPSRSQIFNEKTNIKLGTRYLQELIGLFDGNYALAIASYNAGPGAGMRWYRQWKDLQTDEIIEEIPYTETHGYTKKVLSWMGTYRYVWGDWNKEETRSLDLPRLLPAKLGKFNGIQK